jgi:hypothetical protein
MLLMLSAAVGADTAARGIMATPFERRKMSEESRAKGIVARRTKVNSGPLGTIDVERCEAGHPRIQKLALTSYRDRIYSTRAMIS